MFKDYLDNYLSGLFRKDFEVEEYVYVYYQVSGETQWSFSF